MADVYGPQQLLARNLLPPALVQGHPGYLRADARRAAAPAARTCTSRPSTWHATPMATGGWCRSARRRLRAWATCWRTGSSSSRQFPEAFRDLKVQRLAATYRALMDGLQRMCPAGARAAHRAAHARPLQRNLLRARLPGALPGHHAGRGQRPHRARPAPVPQDAAGPASRCTASSSAWTTSSSTRWSCAPIHAWACRACCRRSAPATCWWPTRPARPSWNRTALLGFLPALSRHLLGEELQLPVAGHLVVRRARRDGSGAAAAGRLRVIKPTYGGAGRRLAVLGQAAVARRELDEWAGRIVREAEAHTVQAYLPLSQMPTWTRDRRPRPHRAALADAARVRGVATARSRGACCPGGLTRLAGRDAARSPRCSAAAAAPTPGC